jgi:hypothetical protein
VCLEATTGRVAWRVGLPAHSGARASSGDGECVVLACFSDGLRRCTATKGMKGHLTTREPCRLAAVSFTGRRVLVAGRANRLLLLDDHGRGRGIHLLERPAVALAVAPLGERAVVALTDGGVRALDLGK